MKVPEPPNCFDTNSCNNSAGPARTYVNEGLYALGVRNVNINEQDINVDGMLEIALYFYHWHLYMKQEGSNDTKSV